MEKKAEEVERYADAKNSKMFISAIKTDYGPTWPCFTPLLSTNGSTLLKERCSINIRWTGHFNNLLNRSSTIEN